jgi:hypothetical protein
LPRSRFAAILDQGFVEIEGLADPIAKLTAEQLIDR